LSFFLLLVRATPASLTNTLSLHDALPIFPPLRGRMDTLDRARTCSGSFPRRMREAHQPRLDRTLRDWLTRPITSTRDTYLREAADRKSTRLNSSHVKISYAVFCLKKKINT